MGPAAERPGAARPAERGLRGCRSPRASTGRRTGRPPHARRCPGRTRPPARLARGSRPLGHRLSRRPERDLLRACPAPRCVRYFVKQHPRREWCRPSCGNRARVARHSARRRERAAEAPG
ncbi:MAG TPA: CGNR zinc finger domain-containing protein [Streptomyces sp.]